MKHPEILLLPVLMLSDYFLTVLGGIQREKRYNDHFKMQHYELNPIWQKSISRKRWLNPRHLLLTVLVTGVFAAALEFGDMPGPFVEGVFGALFVLFGCIIGRHLSNILIFRRFAQNREEISGQVTMAHSLVLAMSTYQYLAVGLPVAIIAVFSPTPFVIGGAAGISMLFVVHCVWMLRSMKKSFNPQGGANGGQPPGSEEIHASRVF